MITLKQFRENKFYNIEYCNQDINIWNHDIKKRIKYYKIKPSTLAKLLNTNTKSLLSAINHQLTPKLRNKILNAIEVLIAQK